MTSPIDTEFWTLTATVGWVKKETANPTSKKCEHCNGHGQVGGGFKSIDGPTDCYHCSGIGVNLIYPDVPPAPEIPKELLTNLKKTFKEFFDGKCSLGSECNCNGDTEQVQKSCSYWQKGYSE